MGTLYYPPNADGIRWFIQQVFPLVRQKLPGVKLTIIGKNPQKISSSLLPTRKMALLQPGSCRNWTPICRVGHYLRSRPAGGGMRVRILKRLFARAAPVVTTTVGIEGIDARFGEDVLVADSPEDFAGSVITLLQDKELQQKLAINGRRLVESKYDWQVVLGELDRVYQGLAGTRKS